MSKRLFVPTLVDAANLNAQVNNAREILAGWDVPDWQVHTLAYHDADPRLLQNPQVHVARLWRRHGWYLHMFLSYLRAWDLVFYPGVYPAEMAALRWRRRFGRPLPVIATLEGLLGDPVREREYSDWAGHPVHCQRVPAAALQRVDERNRDAFHIIAISPFLERMGRRRYGDKFSVLPLGINADWYFPATRPDNARLRVVSAGGVNPNKRPALMLSLAERLPACDFIWYGEGSLRDGLQREAVARGLHNVQFPGALQAPQLGEALRAADIFVMPSLSEGVPKVTQEAAACGLAQVVFGCYEAPSVRDGENGFVVWDDAQFIAKVAELCGDRALVRRFAAAGVELSQAWDWRKVAPAWRQKIIELAESRTGRYA